MSHVPWSRDWWRMMTVAVILAVAAVVAHGRPTVAQDDTLAVVLMEYQASGVAGTATLATAGTGIEVTMEMSGAALVGEHPTHIHTGTCADFDPDPLIPLTTVVLDPVSQEGLSATTVTDVTLSELLADDYVILVHKSHTELLTYFVCGDIKPMAVPVTGVGTAAGRIGGMTSPWVLPAAAAALVMGVAGYLWEGRARPGR